MILFIIYNGCRNHTGLINATIKTSLPYEIYAKEWVGDSFMTGWAGCALLRDGQLDSMIFHTGVDEGIVECFRKKSESDIFTVGDRTEDDPNQS